MHHSEIGRIIRIIEDFSLLSNSANPSSIRSIEMPNRSPDLAGLLIFFDFPLFRLTVEIRDYAEDSNNFLLSFYYPTDAAKPLVTSHHGSSVLQLELIRRQVRSAILLSKTYVDGKDLDNDDELKSSGWVIYKN